MNITVKHNGTDITTRVISYSREHNICTSIGILQLVLESTYSTSIDPWDTIDIYEDGDFKVKYYVSSRSESIPDGTITVECQDKSKRLVDYFIPDTYTIDYPSYTRYWIEKFLDEAGINYNFIATGQGNLLSNYTTLGLQSAYDQILMLLQMSGWYMYFTGNGVATIGTLDTDLAHSTGSLGKSNILEIKVVTDDKMLRNRAVVWGQFDPFRQEYAFADVSKHTRWNYDHRDLRAVVVSNNNIPNKNSAYDIANKLMKEFSRATITKHIVANGARNYSLGGMLRVNSNVWRGKGMITTFGVSMSRGGLTTSIILDERCPRLFGFFNFGDYVYVGTFGDGIWRKHIKFDPTWYNFSTGLTDLHTTDLHINNGVFASVSHSGGIFYANDEEGSWNEIIINSLESSINDTVVSGEIINNKLYSGIMGRACIVDKFNNTIKYAVDTASGLNYGDYFLDNYSTTVFSGIAASGEHRSWIVDFDPYTGTMISGYPVSYSGNYSIFVVDLENDGINDYVSVGSTEGIITISGNIVDREFNYGTNPDQYNNSQISLSTLSNSPQMITDSVIDDNLTVYRSFMADNVDDHQIIYLRYHQPTNSYSVIRLRYINKGFFFTQKIPQAGSLPLLGSGIDSASDSLSSNILRETVNNYKRYLISAASINIVDESSTFPIYKHRILCDDADGGPITEQLTQVATVGVPAGMSFEPPEFPFVLGITVRPYFFDTFAVIVWIWGYLNGTSHSITKLWYQTFNYESEELNDATLVYENPIGNAGVKLFKYNDSFQTIGYKCSAANDNYYVLGGTNLNVTEIESFAGAGAVTSFGENTFSDTISVWEINMGVTSVTLYGQFGYVSGFNEVRAEDVSYIEEVDGTIFAFVPDTSNNANNKLMYTSLSPFVGAWITVDFGDDLYPITFPYQHLDTMTGKAFISLRSQDSGSSYLTYLDVGPYTINKKISKSHTSISGDELVRIRNVGNFIYYYWHKVTLFLFSRRFILNIFRNQYPLLYTGAEFLVLQRDGTNFNLIQRSDRPIRVDISNSSPILTVRDKEDTFQSNFVYGDSLTQVIPISGLGAIEVRDYRYTTLETVSGVMASGVGAESQAVYVAESGIFIGDLNTYSGGFYLFDTIFSGEAERVETSNFVYPGQFIFVSTSGDSPAFYQRDNTDLFFTGYSGLPSSRATIIRVDDRF